MDEAFRSLQCSRTRRGCLMLSLLASLAGPNLVSMPGVLGQGLGGNVNEKYVSYYKFDWWLLLAGASSSSLLVYFIFLIISIENISRL